MKMAKMLAEGNRNCTDAYLGTEISLLVLVSAFTPVRVEPVSLTELTTSRMEALQDRRSSASSLETFTQFFLYRARVITQVICMQKPVVAVLEILMHPGRRRAR